MRNIAIDKLPITTHCNIPVMTTEMLADLYDTEPKLIRQNYQRNADRFIEGKHCFKLIGEELRAFKNESSQRGLLNIAPKVSHLFLWTARGAARHAKILETEKAWEVFEKLEDCYFDRKPANVSGDVHLSGGADLSKATQVIEKFMPAIMEAIKLEDKKEYSAPLKPGYRSLIHSPSGVLGLTENSLLMNLLNQLQEDGHDVSGAAAELTTMFCYIVGVSKCLRDIQTHAEYINDKAGFF
ncbi:TPA: ORF6N domain-containing protein [Escherichia coli]|nr:ORF6N domain-containing protein [Escherichia coli]HAI5626399.1 ORF6N domain-containing protein [Escherichia coli]HEI4172116.1 ORF6N domain-containing protein [Escherichia coli]